MCYHRHTGEAQHLVFLKMPAAQAKVVRASQNEVRARAAAKVDVFSVVTFGFDVQDDQCVVVASAMTRPGHRLSSLASQHSGLGTAVRCHYNVLHMAKHNHFAAQSVEVTSYRLCQMYSRADKVVCVADASFLAGNPCERGT